MAGTGYKRSYFCNERPPSVRQCAPETPAPATSSLELLAGQRPGRVLALRQGSLVGVGVRRVDRDLWEPGGIDSSRLADSWVTRSHPLESIDPPLLTDTAQSPRSVRNSAAHRRETGIGARSAPSRNSQ
ncbi:MAG: hypothetical protein QOG45_510 [Chloroflexota bacterium]|jgi:hypothetical protein|nr:hypothetical protein [Chloroflexota bacterium]